jgi:hypothetical protein
MFLKGLEMDYLCSRCGTITPASRFPKDGSVPRCRGCGDPLPVVNAAPPVSRLRPKIILGTLLCMVLALAAGGYCLYSHLHSRWTEFKERPAETLTSLLNLGEPYEACREYLANNSADYPFLGKTFSSSLLKQKVSIVNGKKTAELTLKITGEHGDGLGRFSLEKDDRKWNVESASVKRISPSPGSSDFPPKEGTRI